MFLASVGTFSFTPYLNLGSPLIEANLSVGLLEVRKIACTISVKTREIYSKDFIFRGEIVRSR